MGKPTTIPKKISSLLQAGDQLSHLGRMLNKQQALLQVIRSLLPETLAEHCLHARISGRLLIIHTDSPVWNSRLRFHGPQILQAMQKQAPHLQQLKINIHIDPIKRPSGRRQVQLSAQSAGQILDAAESIADEKLQAALRRLGSPHQK